MTKAVIVDAVRTPMGRSKKGALRHVRAEALGAHVIEALLQRSPSLAPAMVDEVIWGCANQTLEQGFNVARMTSLIAGLPPEVPAYTVNRLCASSLQAINNAAMAVACGDGEVYICGGVEHMGHVAIGHGADPSPAYSLRSAKAGWSMGLTAEMLAKLHHVARSEQDTFALRSHQRAAAAQQAGSFNGQIIAMQGEDTDGVPLLLDYDEVVRRDATLEALGSLKPAFDPRGSVTAGNSSAIADGASAVLVMRHEKAKELGLEPMATIKSFGTAGVDPSIMGYGAAPAAQKALKKAGMHPRDLQVVELNEAFAAQSIPVLRDLGLWGQLDDKVNLNGGAIALGHPLGCSGARITTSCLHLMQQRNAQTGMAFMCVGMGQGVATVFERL